MKLKKRILWVEDCNESNGGKNGEEALKRKFLSNSGLSDRIVDWAGSLESAINKLNNSNIYDLVILDLDFTTNGYPVEFKGYISKEKYDDCQIVSKDTMIRKTGYLLFLYLIMRERFPIDRICFFSANIYKNDLDEGYDLLLSEDVRQFSKSISHIMKEINDDNIKKELQSIQKQIMDFLKAGKDEKVFLNNLIHQKSELLEIVAKCANERNLNKDESDIYKQDFLNYKNHFENSGMIIPKTQLFGKPGNDNLRRIRKFYDFTHKDENYYQLKYCIVNMCEILNDAINTNSITINMRSFNDNKYQSAHYISMLDSVKSRFKTFFANNKTEISNLYNSVVYDLVAFMEEACAPDYNSLINNINVNNHYIAAHAVMKFLRNMLSHGKINKSDMSPSFCAFIFGISMRYYFDIANINNEDYFLLEKELLNCISKCDENPVISSKGTNIRELVWKTFEKNPKNKSKICSFSNNMYITVAEYGDRSLKSIVELKMFYWLFTFCIFPVNLRLVENSKAKDYSVKIEVMCKRTNGTEIWYEYLNRIKELDPELKDCFTK